MKKLALATTALIAFASTASAVEQNFPNFYIGLGGGVTGQTSSEFKNGGQKNTVDWDAGYDYKASIGYQPPEFGGFRVEAEYSNHHQDSTGSNNGDTTANVGAVNVYYDFFNPSVLTPYLGGGLGYGSFNASHNLTGINNSSGGNNDESRPIYQGILGVSWQPNTLPDVAFDLNYRYLAPFSELKEDGAKYDYDNHSVEVGARFKF